MKFNSIPIVFLLFVVISVVTATTNAGLENKKAQQHVERRTLIEDGRRIQYIDDIQRCTNSQWGSPCGPGSACEDTETGYICSNPFVYGCPAGCTQYAKCLKGADNLYSCVCDPGYYQPEPWMPCRLEK
jgi:hypothetical protein